MPRGVVARSILVALAALAAGCSTPGESGDDTCETRYGGTLVPFVSLVPTLQDDPDVALRRLGEVVNDTPQGAPANEGTSLVWQGERGTFRWVRDGNASARVSWTGTEPLADPRGAIEAALLSFQHPFDVLPTADGTRAQQAIGGVPIEGTGASYEELTLTVGPVVQMDPNSVLAADDALLARGREVAACVDGDATADAALRSYQLRDEVLTRRVEVQSGPEGCAGPLHVDLHAVDRTLATPILCGASPQAETASS